MIAQDDPDQLLTITSELTKHIRHPRLETGYYQELFEIHSAWSNVLKKPMVYDDYFNGVEAVDTASYFAALIDASPRRPVFQECRTCARIGDLKEKLGGYHIHLWRNPWDQWWSYKTTDYFDTAHLLFVNAAQPPDPILRLREEINFVPYHADGVTDEFKHFYAHRLKPGDNYMVFYTLWCLAVLAGTSHADALWNIDALSASPDQRQKMLDMTAQAGITGIDLSDCNIPQAVFSDMERDFFEAIEHRVHETMLAPSMGRESVETILELRKRNQPKTQDKRKSRSKAARTTRVLHHLVRRIEEREFHRVRGLRSELQTFEQDKQKLEKALRVANTETQKLETKLKENLDETTRDRNRFEQEKQTTQEHLRGLEQSLQAVKANNQRLENKTQTQRRIRSDLERNIADKGHQIDAIRSSLSWKITAPLRWVYARLFRRREGQAAGDRPRV